MTGNDPVKQIMDALLERWRGKIISLSGFERTVRGVVVQLNAESEHLRAQLVKAWNKSDREMLRVKACEHIAEGDEGWERLTKICPSTAAVGLLREQLEAERTR